VLRDLLYGLSSSPIPARVQEQEAGLAQESLAQSLLSCLKPQVSPPKLSLPPTNPIPHTYQWNQMGGGEDRVG
jgi:hypothetical protein